MSEEKATEPTPRPHRIYSDNFARKVWLLPTELSERIKAFQASQGIVSEVEAARRLLDSALQMWDTPLDILRRLQASFQVHGNVRSAAADVLARHAQVARIEFPDGNSLTFDLRSGSKHTFSVKELTHAG